MFGHARSDRAGEYRQRLSKWGLAPGVQNDIRKGNGAKSMVFSISLVLDCWLWLDFMSGNVDLGFLNIGVVAIC
jgi:hypothetical protein